MHRFKSNAGRLNLFLLALIASLPVGNQQATNLCLLLLGVQTLILARKGDWLSAIKNPLVYTSILFFGILALSLLWSDDISEGGRQLETKLSFLVVPLFIAAGSFHWEKNFRNKALQAFIVGNLIAILIALSYAVFRTIQEGAPYIEYDTGTKYFFLYVALAEPIMHAGYMATYVGFALLITIYFYLETPIKSRRRAYLILGVGLFVFLLMLQARINLIALMVVFGLGIARWLWRKRSLQSAMIVGAGLVLLLFLGFFMPQAMKDRYLQMPDMSYDISGDQFNSATFRLAIWKCSSAVISDSPWIGTGIGDNRKTIKQSYQDHQFHQGVARGFNSHNQFMESLVSTGMLGLFSLVLMFSAHAYGAMKANDTLALAFVIFFVICVLTESMLERMWGVQLFTVMGMVLGGTGSRHEAEQARGPRLKAQGLDEPRG